MSASNRIVVWHTEQREKKRRTINKARIGKRVTTYNQIHCLALDKASVVVPADGQVFPAAWVLGMQYQAVSLRIASGMFIYRKEVAK